MTRRAVVHIEIPSKDQAESANFYQDMFGWEFEHMPGSTPYTSFSAENTAGGFPDVGEMYKPGDVVIYIASDDLADDLKKIESLGGKIIMPHYGSAGIWGTRLLQ